MRNFVHTLQSKLAAAKPDFRDDDSVLGFLCSAYYEACRLNRNLHLCMYSLLDIAIHYDGASYNQVREILTSTNQMQSWRNWHTR